MGKNGYRKENERSHLFELTLKSVHKMAIVGAFFQFPVKTIVSHRLYLWPYKLSRRLAFVNTVLNFIVAHKTFFIVTTNSFCRRI